MEVRVRVAEADEVERRAPGQPLVAGLEVDLRVAVPGADAGVVVVVAAVDVDPDAAERVDDLLEAAEVDGDQVVDREAGQPADRLERPLRAAGRVRRVDLRAELVSGAADVDDHVSREREHRDRLRLRIGPQEHERVGARGRSLRLTVPAVVADHERDRGLVRRRHRVEARLRLLHVGRVRADRGDALVDEQVDAADEREGEHEQAGADDREDAADDPEPASRTRVWGLIPVDRRQRVGWEADAPVTVDATAVSPFQRRPHEVSRVPSRLRGVRVAQRPRYRTARAALTVKRRSRRARTRGSEPASARPRKRLRPCAPRSPRPGRGRSAPRRSTSTAGGG